MALTDSLRILITANGAQAEREFSKVGAASRRNLGQAETSAQRYGSTLTSAGVAMATFGAVALVGLAKAAQAAEEERGALLRLENSIQNMPELAGATTAAFLDQAAALQDTTKFADDMTVSAQAMLGTFHLTEAQILELTPVVQDYAAKFGVDLVTASKQVGRAVSGSSGALTRNGIVMDEAAFAADSFGTTLDALRENAGGFAAQEGQTLSGQMAILKNNVMDLAEGVGVGATEAFSDMAGAVGFLSDAMEDVDPATLSAAGQLATWGAVGLTAVGATSFLAGQVMKLAPAFQAVVAIGPRVYAAIANMIVPTTALTTAFTAEATAATAAGTATKAFAAGPVGLFVLALAGASVGVAKLVEEIGDMTGAFHMPLTWTSVDQWNSQIYEAIDANPDLVSALSTGKQGFEGIGTAMSEASQSLDELSQEIQDYLDGVFDLPSAQRDLRQSFDDLFSTLLEEGHTTDDVAAGLQRITEATAGVIAAGGDANLVAALSIERLKEQKRAGLITREEYQFQRDAILNIPGVSRTLFEQPGMATAQDRTVRYRGMVVSVPPGWRTNFTANTGGAIGSVQALIDKIRDLNNTSTGSIASRIGQITAGLSQNAEGGIYPLGGGMSIVGERGPEIVTIPTGGRVFNNAESKMRLKGGTGNGTGRGHGVTVHVHGNVYGVADLAAEIDKANRRHNLARTA